MAHYYRNQSRYPRNTGPIQASDKRIASNKQIRMIAALTNTESALAMREATRKQASDYIDLLMKRGATQHWNKVPAEPWPDEPTPGPEQSSQSPAQITGPGYEVYNPNTGQFQKPAPRPGSVKTYEERQEEYKKKLPKALLDMIPNGYYAWAPDDLTALTFLRVSAIKKGWQAGARKIQTQHSDILHDGAVVYSDGTVRIHQAKIPAVMMGIFCDYKSALRRYATEIGRCSRCNKRLTDERSRHYAIGPECEKHWPWMITEIDDVNGGLSYEELKYRGLLNS